MKIFEIERGRIGLGATVSQFKLSNGVTIPAIIVGEEGRGRKLGIIPVQGNYADGDKIKNVTIGTTRAGNPKFIASEQDTTTDAIVVLRTPIGYRGGNRHGEKIVWKLTDDWTYWANDLLVRDTLREILESKEAKDKAAKEEIAVMELQENSLIRTGVSGDLPGEMLTQGTIAQGGAGRMGSGYQYILHIKAGDTWAVKLSGRLYGQPSAYEYRYDGGGISVMTAEEKELI